MGSTVQAKNSEDLQTVTFGNGCFWCTEAVFQRLQGVASVVSGYSGGNGENPSYEAVCGGRTGHAEVVQIMFDPQAISYAQLLEVFWQTHDPTTLNQQGNDVGTQYRSVIFYHDEEQKKLAEQYKEELDRSGVFANAIVTEISPATEFYPAEGYHQNYYNLNSSQPYCTVVINPKLEKFQRAFHARLKADD